MRRPRLNWLLAAAILGYLMACSPAPPQVQDPGNQAQNAAFDSLLAVELQADDYGMSRYIMAFLKRGPNRSLDSIEQVKLQRAHLDNIKRMAEEGKLVLAGPFLDDSEIRGIYIFNITDIEEARSLTETDPAIQEGALEMELRPWYGSAALKLVNEWHSKLSKTPI